MKDDHQFAMYVHYMAHKLNRVLVECCKVSRSAMGFLNVVEKLYSVFAELANHQMFVDMQTALGLKQKEIVQPSDTCRARKWRSVFAIKKHITLPSCGVSEI